MTEYTSLESLRSDYPVIDKALSDAEQRGYDQCLLEDVEIKQLYLSQVLEAQARIRQLEEALAFLRNKVIMAQDSYPKLAWTTIIDNALSAPKPEPGPYVAIIADVMKLKRLSDNQPVPVGTNMADVDEETLDRCGEHDELMHQLIEQILARAGAAPESERGLWL